MSWLAFLGGFFVVTLGIIADYVTGSWAVLAWGAAVLLTVLVLIAPPSGGNKKPPPAVKCSRRRKLK